MRLLSHNVFWFQGYPYPGDSPGPADRAIVRETVAIYQRLEADMHCLQEIQSVETSEVIGGAMNLGARFVAGGEFPQYGGCVLGGGGVESAGGGGGGALPARVWQRVDVETCAGRLRVVNVHAPSNRQLGEAASEARRLAEFRAGLAEVPELDVLAGDFNEGPGGAIDRLLTEAGYIDCAVARGQGDRPTTVSGGRGDWIWIHPRWRGALKRYGVLGREEFGSGVVGKRYISDHLPLWIDLDIRSSGVVSAR